MGRPVARWNSLGKWFSIVVVLCFFLPFFGVSCKGMDVVHVSGADMVGGCKPGGLATMGDELGGDDERPSHRGKAPSDDFGLDVSKGTDRVPLAIVAMLAAIAVAGAAFMRDRRGIVLAVVFGVVTIGSLVGLYFTVTNKMDELVAEQEKVTAGKQGLDGAMANRMQNELQKEMKIDAGSRWGFWVTLFGMAGVAGLAAAALKKGVDDPLPPLPLPPAGPPPAA